MRRWTGFYDELAASRYPALLAYADLLTGELEAADALVASALRRTFAKPRRLRSAGEAEYQVRVAIVTEFLASARGHGEETAAGSGTPQATQGESRSAENDPHTPAAAGTLPHPAANPYAPPPPGSSGDREAHAERASAAVRDVAVAPERTSREPRSARIPDDEAQLRGTLQSLPPQARAVAVLRHHDGLTPGQICERLGMTVDVVRERLQEVSAAVRTWLGLETADQSLNVDGMSAAEVTVADHAWRS